MRRGRREKRDAEGAETETRGGKLGGSILLSSRLGGLEERRKLPSGVRGRALAENSCNGFLSTTKRISGNR